MKKVILALLVLTAIVACESDDTEVVVDPTPDPIGNTDDDPQDPVPNQVQLRTDATFGQILTDADGFYIIFLCSRQ